MLSLSIGKQNTADRISRESGMNCLFVFVRISPVITNSQPLLPKLSHLVPRDSWEPAFGIEKPSGTQQLAVLLAGAQPHDAGTAPRLNLL